MARTLHFASMVGAVVALVACGSLQQDILSTKDAPSDPSEGGPGGPGTPDAAVSDARPVEAAPPGSKCVAPGTTVELFRIPEDEITKVVASGPRLFAYAAGLNALAPSFVRFDLETRTLEPFATVPLNGAFGVDDAHVYFVGEVPGSGTKIVRYRADTNVLDSWVDFDQLPSVFAPKLDLGMAFAAASVWSFWAPNQPPSSTLSQGGVGAPVAVTAGPAGKPYYVLAGDTTVDLRILSSLGGSVTTLPGPFTAMARAPGGVVVGNWNAPSGARIILVLDSFPSIAQVLDLADGTPVGAIAAAEGGMVWAQSEQAPPPVCIPGMPIYRIFTHAIPDGSFTSPEPEVVASGVKSRADCSAPAVAMDECNFYWVDGDRVMARGVTP